jgi:predicted lipid-binding transport protein (Tim44 family)
VRPWHPQIGFLPAEDEDPPAVEAIEEPGPVDHPPPASYVGWIWDDELGAIRPPASAAPPPAPAPAPERPKGAAGVRGALRGVLAAGLRRLARVLDD